METSPNQRTTRQIHQTLQRFENTRRKVTDVLDAWPLQFRMHHGGTFWKRRYQTYAAVCWCGRSRSLNRYPKRWSHKTRLKNAQPVGFDEATKAVVLQVILSSASCPSISCILANAYLLITSQCCRESGWFAPAGRVWEDWRTFSHSLRLCSKNEILIW